MDKKTFHVIHQNKIKFLDDVVHYNFTAKVIKPNLVAYILFANR